jgi:hypothetical protein
MSDHETVTDYEYKDHWVCPTGEGHYRVKASPDDGHALHHGSFETRADAEGFIDDIGGATHRELRPGPIVTVNEPQRGIQPAPEQQLNPLVQAVLSGADIDPEKLDKLLAVQERYEQGQAKKAYSEAMAAFRSEAPVIDRNARVNFTSSKGTTDYQHSTLGYSLSVINPILGKHGLNPSWRTEQLDGGLIRVTCRLTHAMGHYEETALQASPDQSGNKNNIQAIGSTVSYLERYTLFSICGLASGTEDDDGGAGGDGDGDGGKPPYPDDKFNENLPNWQSLIESGQKTAAAVIRTVESAYTMPDSQKEKLNAVKVAAPPQEDGDQWVSDYENTLGESDENT